MARFMFLTYLPLECQVLVIIVYLVAIHFTIYHFNLHFKIISKINLNKLSTLSIKYSKNLKKYCKKYFEKKLTISKTLSKTN